MYPSSCSSAQECWLGFLRRPLCFSRPNAVYCEKQEGRGNDDQTAGVFTGRAGLDGGTAGGLRRAAGGSGAGLCADLCGKPAGRLPHHRRGQAVCGAGPGADRGQGARAGQGQRRVRHRGRSMGAAGHRRRGLCTAVALGADPRSAAAEHFAAALPLSGFCPHVAGAGWSHRRIVSAGGSRAGHGGPELVRRRGPVLLLHPAHPQPRRPAGQDHPGTGLPDRHRPDPSAGGHAGQLCLQRRLRRL